MKTMILLLTLAFGGVVGCAGPKNAMTSYDTAPRMQADTLTSQGLTDEIRLQNEREMSARAARKAAAR